MSDATIEFLVRAATSFCIAGAIAFTVLTVWIVIQIRKER